MNKLNDSHTVPEWYIIRHVVIIIGGKCNFSSYNESSWILLRVVKNMMEMSITQTKEPIALEIIDKYHVNL